jgi:LmbE family N-acetylglucosaminyl deacetylase
VVVIRFRRVLAVFPHPDDESMTCGGTLRRLADAGAAVTLVVLTRGERGTRDGSASAELGGVRAGEARRAAAVLGVTELVQEDLGDGRLRDRRDEVAAAVQRTLARAGADLVVTYDLAGLYGHDDHVVCSEVVTQVARRERPDAALWYVAMPRWRRPFVPVPAALRGRRATPTHRVFVGGRLLARGRAILAHRTQLRPAWLLLPLLPFEHFAAVPAGPQDSSRTRRNASR